MAIYRGEFLIVEEYGTEDPHKVYRDLIGIFAAGHAKRLAQKTQQEGGEAATCQSQTACQNVT